MPHSGRRKAKRKSRSRKRKAKRATKSVVKRVAKKVTRRVTKSIVRRARSVVRDSLSLSVLGRPDSRPQYLTFGSSITAVGVYTITPVNLPVVPVGDAGLAMVFEILSLDWYLNPGDITLDEDAVVFAFLTTGTQRVTGDTVTTATIQHDCGLGLNFGFYSRQHMLIQTSTSVGTDNASASAAATVWETPYHIDFTDGIGNGFVVASDRIFLVCGGLDDLAASRAICKIKYRQIIVSALEYVSLAQSQG